MLKMTLGQGPLSQKQIELVRVLIQDDRRVTYDILEVLTSLSRESLEWIIHDHIGYNKIASRWIAHLRTKIILILTQFKLNLISTNLKIKASKLN